MSRKGPTPPRQWQPLEPARPRHNPVAERMWRDLGEDPAELEMWMNNQYVVIVHRGPDRHVAHLSIRRTDRKPARDWRDFQRIKNELAGRETEAVELYPAHSRVVDAANQYHLWVLPPGVTMPLGFRHGLVMDPTEIDEELGAVQRPFDPPQLSDQERA